MVTEDKGKEFAKELGLFETCSIAIGAMIGGGIFSILGALHARTGPSAVLAFALSGIICLLTAHSYIRLSLLYPSSGGEFVFLRRSFRSTGIGDFIGILLWLGYSVTVALYAFTFGLYISEALHSATGSDIFTSSFLVFFSVRRFFAFFVIFVFMTINLIGVKETGMIQNVIVILKVGILVLLAAVGIFFIDFGNYDNFLPENGIPAIVIGGALIFVSYEGFQVISNTIEEMKHPEKDVKKGMYLSVAIVIFIYVSVTFVTIGLVSGSISEAALQDAAGGIFGITGILVITIGAIASTSSAINATLLGSSRLAYTMSTWRSFPRKLAKISKKTKVPFVSIIITSVISWLFTFFGNARSIAEVGSSIFLVVFLFIHLSTIKSFPRQRNLIAKLSVLVILIYLALLGYEIIVHKETLTIVILSAFSLAILTWLIFNKYQNKNADSSDIPQIPDPILDDVLWKLPIFQQQTARTDQFFINLDNIFLPVSGKKHEITAVHLAASMAKKYNAVLHLFSVTSSPRWGHYWITEIAAEYGIKYTITIINGSSVSTEIIKEYHKNSYQLVILASRRKNSRISRLLRRSISSKILANLNTTILQVHPPRISPSQYAMEDMILLLDGSERDGFLARWSKLIASVGPDSIVYSYHILLFPRTLSLQSHSDDPSLELSNQNFNAYSKSLGEIVGLNFQPVFLYGYNFVNSVTSASTIRDADAVLIGHTRDKRINPFRTPLAFRLLHKVDSAVIVHHMPRDEKI